MKVKAILDPQFIPMALLCREMREATEKDGQDIVIGIERNKGYISAYRTRVYPDGVGKDELNFEFIERMVKALLWVRGGYKIIIAGSELIGNKIKDAYAKGGLRDFDNGFMSRVYERPFEVVVTTLDKAPVTSESASPVGRHLDGCRIGFDAGGSDRKVSAVIDGEAVFSEEVVWFPKTNADPKYHYDGILQAMKTAASHMPRVDGIGVSSAGVYVDNRIMIASLFLKVSDEDFDKHVKNMYLDVAKEIGENIPVEVANDGDVTALAGAMDLEDDSVLGVAMGTSEAGGYVEGGLTAWRLMTDGAAELGLSSHEVPADAGRLAAELAEGHPVICSVRPGDFTDTGHFLVVAGVADNGELVIHDPNSPANSARTWDVQRVLAQCANLWAFEWV